jgi:hypothetical protein
MDRADPPEKKENQKEKRKKEMQWGVEVVFWVCEFFSVVWCKVPR